MIKGQAKRKRRGSALVLTAGLVAILIVLGVGLLQLGLSARIQSARSAAVIAARAAADAGLSDAVYMIKKKLEKEPVWNPDDLPAATDEELGNATFSYTVTEDTSSGYICIVESIGKSRQAVRTVYATLQLRGSGECGVLVQDFIELKSGTFVDGRDSRYPDDPDPDVNVQIGTTSIESDKIVLNNGVVVDGDVLVGYSGDPNIVIKDLGATVTGYMGSLMEEPEFPPIYPPALELGLFEELYAKGEDLFINETWNGRYSMIDLDNQGVGVERPARLIVESGDVVLHLTNTAANKPAIDLGVGCEIIIKDGATLNLYVDGGISSGTDSGFNNQGTPPDLKIWGNWRGLNVDQKWQLNAKSEYFGQIYAPSADITANAKTDLYGAFTANSFVMNSGGNLFYDGALIDVHPDDEGVRFVLKRWWE